MSRRPLGQRRDPSFERKWESAIGLAVVALLGSACGSSTELSRAESSDGHAERTSAFGPSVDDDLQVCFALDQEDEAGAFISRYISPPSGRLAAGVEQVITNPTDTAFAVGVRFDGDEARRALLERTKTASLPKNVTTLVDAAAEDCP